MRRKKNDYRETRGNLEGRGKTSVEAKIDLNSQIDWAVSYHPTYIETLLGHLIVISPNAHGYQVTVASIEKSKVYRNLVHCAHAPLNQLVRRARVDVCQRAWTETKIDELYIESTELDDEGKEQLRSWIRFQRLYAEHIEHGATPAEAHRLSCEGRTPVRTIDV